MRVTTELADIEFEIGEISRRDKDLFIESATNSTLAVRILVTPRDALVALGRLLSSAGTWAFLLRLPIAWISQGRNENSEDRAWQRRRHAIGPNKPW